jgi:hypothetical protein
MEGDDIMKSSGTAAQSLRRSPKFGDSLGIGPNQRWVVGFETFAVAKLANLATTVTFHNFNFNHGCNF